MVLANPRSRTKWLSEYLGCGHDLMLGCKSFDEFVAKLRNTNGTVETSVAIGYPLWRSLFPYAKFVVIHRMPLEVGESFSRLGFEPDWMFIYNQDRALWELAETDKKTMLFTFESLNKLDIRSNLCDWVGVKGNEKIVGDNIQVDFQSRLEEVKAHQSNIACFYSNLAKKLIYLDYKR